MTSVNEIDDITSVKYEVDMNSVNYEIDDMNSVNYEVDEMTSVNERISVNGVCEITSVNEAGEIEIKIESSDDEILATDGDKFVRNILPPECWTEDMQKLSKMKKLHYRRYRVSFSQLIQNLEMYMYV